MGRLRDAWQVLRGYAAAQDSRASSWAASGGSATAEVGAAAPTVARRARDAVRNDPYAARIVDLWTGNAVGAGITTRWPDKAHAQAWRRWAESTACDAEGRLDLYGLQALVMRAVVESGECFVRFLMSAPSPANPIGLRLQVLESDHLDTARTGLVDGAPTIQGISLGEAGEPIGYWLHRVHPGAAWILPGATWLRSERVAASEVLHIYRKRRPGQLRDVSWLAPVLTRLRDLGDYEAALLMKAKIEACLAAVVSEDAVLISGRDHQQAEAKHLGEAVLDALGRARIVDASGETLGHAEALDGVLYVLRTGCAWRHLPLDFPPWQTTLRWFLRLARSGAFERMAHALAMADRERVGREPSPTAALVDAQAVRSGGTGVAGPRGYGAAKRVVGRKRHALVDTDGRLLLAWSRPPICTTATAPWRCFGPRGAPGPSSRCATRIAPMPGRASPTPRRSASKLVGPKPAQRGFAVQPRRWVIESTFAWTGRCRRLARDHEATPSSAVSFFVLAVATVLLRRLAKPL